MPTREKLLPQIHGRTRAMRIRLTSIGASQGHPSCHHRSIRTCICREKPYEVSAYTDVRINEKCRARGSVGDLGGQGLQVSVVR